MKMREKSFQWNFWIHVKTENLNRDVSLTPALAQKLHKLSLNLGARLNNNFMLQ